MRKIVKIIGMVIIDVFVISISILIAFLLKYDGDVIYIVTKYLKSILYITIIATTIKIFCFILFKLYKSLWSYAGMYEAVSLIAALLVGNVIVVGLAIMLPISIPLAIFITAFFIETLLIGGTRFIYRFLRRIKHKALIRNLKKS